MFQKIMTPVDLFRVDELEKSLQCTADLAKRYDAEVIYVGVTGSAPSQLALDPKSYQEKLDLFVEGQIQKHNISATGKVQHCNDLVTDVDNALLSAIDDVGADLVVMQSHSPKLTDYVWPSNGGKVASHSKSTVMLVRQ